MHQFEQIKTYLDATLTQVRWKQAHDTIRRDLAAHIEDQSEALINSGSSVEEAIDGAICEMGDPIEIGQSLDASYRPKSVRNMLIPLAVLLLLGVLFRLFLYDRTDTMPHFLIALAIGVVCFILFYNANLYRLTRWSSVIFKASFFLLVVIYFFFVMQQNFQKNINVAFFNYLVCVFPLQLVGYMYSLRGKGVWALVACYIAIAIPTGILLSISATDALSIFLACIFILTVAVQSDVFGGRKRLYLSVLLALAIVTSLFIVFGFKIGPMNNPFPPIVKELLARAQLLGAGTDTGITIGFEIANNYMVTSIIYQHGWLPAILLVALLLVFLGIGFYRAFRLSSLYGRLLANAIMASFTVQVLVYIASNMGFIINGSLPLPFLSYGNTSLVINIALAGILLSLYRTDVLFVEVSLEQMHRIFKKPHVI